MQKQSVDDCVRLFVPAAIHVWQFVALILSTLPFFDRLLLFAIPPFAFLLGRFVDLLVTRGLHDWAVRTLMICSLALIAYHSFVEIAKKVVLSELSHKELERRAVIDELDGPVILAENRMPRLMQIYNGFGASDRASCNWFVLHRNRCK